MQFWTPAIGVANTIANGDFLTADGGRTWQPLTPPSGYPVNTFIRFYEPQYPGRAAYPRFGCACFTGETGWVVAFPPHHPEAQAVLASTDAGAHWRPVLPRAVLHPGKANAHLSVWLGGCRGSQAWVEVVQASYLVHGGASYDLLHTSDSGQTWQDVLHIQNGPALPQLKVPLTPAALKPSPLPTGLALNPEPLALPAASAAWLTLLAGNGGIAFAVTADDGQHWQIHRFPAPRHAPRTAPASPSGLATGLPWLATTATDARHACALFASTNGSGASYLYATSDGRATWKRITTFR